MGKQFGWEAIKSVGGCLCVDRIEKKGKKMFHITSIQSLSQNKPDDAKTYIALRQH